MKPSFPVKDGSTWTPEDLFWNLLCSTYGTSLVLQQIPKALMWLVANPDNQKTARGMPRFLNGWMSRCEPLRVEPGVAVVTEFSPDATLDYWKEVRNRPIYEREAPQWVKERLN